LTERHEQAARTQQDRPGGITVRRTAVTVIAALAITAPSYASPPAPPQPITPGRAERAVKKQIKRQYPRSDFRFAACGAPGMSPREPEPRRRSYKCPYLFTLPETPDGTFLQGDATVKVKRGQRIIVKLGPYHKVISDE
jgi:hypothetical protein